MFVEYQAIKMYEKCKLYLIQKEMSVRVAKKALLQPNDSTNAQQIENYERENYSASKLWDLN